MLLCIFIVCFLAIPGASMAMAAQSPVPDPGLSLTAVPGLLVGQITDNSNRTGCTVVLAPEGFTPGVHVPGFAPGSRETELMRTDSLVDAVHGLVLSGGSSFGLAAADGVVRFLREQGHGFRMPHAIIPIVGGAVIYDLDANAKAGFLPDAAMGYEAAQKADSGPVASGQVGAGTGASCGRLFAFQRGMQTSPGGVGSAGFIRADGLIVSALVVVNALGNVHHPDSGAWLSGGRDANGNALNAEALFAALATHKKPGSNTVLAVVATNACLDKQGTNRLARIAAAGLPRAIRPAHLLYDGDIVFALASKTATQPGQFAENLIGALAAEALAHAAANAFMPPKHV